MSRPRRVLMTVDAMGGVWRYGVDLGAALNRAGIACLLVGCGPRPARALAPELQITELQTTELQTTELPATELVWTDAPLDWMVGDAAALDGLAETLAALARDWHADLLHLNLPSQAAGMPRDLPVLAVSHSCVPTWWEAVRGEPLDAAWAWHVRSNRLGLERSDCVLAPSASHAAALRRIYGPIEGLRVVYNATGEVERGDAGKHPLVLAAGRWWDEGKNAAILDQAAGQVSWPVQMAGSLDGPDGQRVRLAHASGLGDVPAPELFALMRRAAIFASPSRYEPFGLAVLEAAMNHAALVLSDIPTFRELWDGAALFAKPGDADGFARAIGMLAGDASLRLRLGAAAAVIARRFTPARQLQGLLDGYAAAIARHAVPTASAAC